MTMSDSTSEHEQSKLPQPAPPGATTNDTARSPASEQDRSVEESGRSLRLDVRSLEVRLKKSRVSHSRGGIKHQCECALTSPWNGSSSGVEIALLKQSRALRLSVPPTRTHGQQSALPLPVHTKVLRSHTCQANCVAVAIHVAYSVRHYSTRTANKAASKHLPI